MDMDLLLLFLFSPAILAQGYGKGDDPNDEPFLPIYPVYPYSPKLIKRGVEKEAVAQLSPELYAPKVDAKDSYSAGHSSNDYSRDSRYSDHGPYTKAFPPSNYAYYSTIPYSYPTAPYNSYSSAYGVPPPPSYAAVPYASYPNYYYQPPYYYPNYYGQPLLPPPPLPPSATDYPGDPYSNAADADKAGKTDGDNKDYGNNDADRYVDGGNFVTASAKDTDGQSSAYRTRSPQNQLVRANDAGVRNFAIPLPRATYRVISVTAQPVAADYSLPATYAKAQQLEGLMSHAWSKLLTQNLPTTGRYPGQEADGVDNEQGKDKSRHSPLPFVSKSSLAYVGDASLLGKLNVGRSTGRLATTRLKSVEYPSLNQGVYATIEKPEQDRPESGEYENYEHSSVQSSPDYDGPSSQADKLRQNYENESTQSVSYRGQNYVTAQTPRGYGYSYRNYDARQGLDQQRSQQRYKNNLDDDSFGAKTKKV